MSKAIGQLESSLGSVSSGVITADFPDQNAFQQAIEIAHGQSAKLFELRAAASLARLWSDQGRRAAARELVAPTSEWFTEEFNLPDLKEAKALLKGLTTQL